MTNKRIYAAAFALAALCLTTIGCGDTVTPEAGGTGAATTAPATVASPGSVTPAGQVVPGNPNSNAAANAAAYEAARKKAEGK
ncbi:MAG: hypothetical protein H7Y38_08715 [Armatimonadetes bacterium]|nr:hypothetical protein [Armatimonadota bacterium]